MVRKGEKIFLRPYKTRVDRCTTFCMLQYIGFWTLFLIIGGWISHNSPIYETIKEEVSFASACQGALTMPVELKDGAVATTEQASKFTKSTLYCKLCLRNRETIGFSGILDLSLSIKLKPDSREDLDLRDGRIPVTFTEIIGGHCSNAEDACKQFDGYSDWTHFPAAINPNPFPATESGNSYSDIIRNKPDYFAVISNSSKVTVNVALQGNNLITSRLASREFSPATSSVYGLLLTLETKRNTQLVAEVTAEKERANGFFYKITLGVDIALFLVTLITFVCGAFEHTDVKYKKWMPQSKSLLMLMVLQLFASHLFRHLFTLFGLDVAAGFLFSSRLLELLINCFHLYFWIDALLSEQPPGTVGDLLVKALLACLCVALTCKEAMRLAEDFRFIQTFSVTSLWTDMVYYILAGIYWFLCICLWINAMRAERTLEIPNARDQDETARDRSRNPASQREQEEQDALAIDAPAPNYNQYNRFICTVSTLTLTLWLQGQLSSSYLMPGVSLYSLLFGRYLLVLSDIFLFLGVSPSGGVFLDDDFGSEDDPYYDEHAREGEDYQAQSTPGFIEGLKQKERLRQSKEGRELDEFGSSKSTRKSSQRADHRGMDQHSDPDDIDVDVDVDNLEDEPADDGYEYDDEDFQNGPSAHQHPNMRRNPGQNYQDDQEDYEDDV